MERTQEPLRDSFYHNLIAQTLKLSTLDHFLRTLLSTVGTHQRTFTRIVTADIVLFYFQAKYSVFIETKGKPGEVICKLVKEKNAFLVVMGSRGLGTIRRTILGSVSQYCIDHAHIPVTVVPPPA